MDQKLKAAIKRTFLVRALLKPVSLWRQSSSDKQLEKTFAGEYDAFLELAKKSKPRFSLKKEDQFPCPHDRTAFTDYDRHYILHPTWAAGILKRIAPSEHVDISSILYFSTLMSNFFKIRFYDYRPAKINIPNFESQQADLMNLHLKPDL